MDDDKDDLPGAPFAPSVVAEMLRAFGKGMEEYDSTLYFLDDAEIDYLKTEIRKDFSTDMRTRVIASLLDRYEAETEPTVHEEIAGVLDNFFLLLLSLTQFRTAAYLIREAAVTASRASGILLAQQQRLMQLTDG